MKNPRVMNVKSRIPTAVLPMPAGSAELPSTAISMRIETPVWSSKETISSPEKT